jgi:hypothetical protein
MQLIGSRACPAYVFIGYIRGIVHYVRNVGSRHIVICIWIDVCPKEILMDSPRLCLGRQTLKCIISLSYELAPVTTQEEHYFLSEVSCSGLCRIVAIRKRQRIHNELFCGVSVLSST